MLKRLADRVNDSPDRLAERPGNFGLGQFDLARDALFDVKSLDADGHAAAVQRNARATDLLLDSFGGGLADLEIMGAADIGHDRIVHLVTTNPDGAAVSEPLERD